MGLNTDGPLWYRWVHFRKRVQCWDRSIQKLPLALHSQPSLALWFASAWLSPSRGPGVSGLETGQ